MSSTEIRLGFPRIGWRFRVIFCFVLAIFVLCYLLLAVYFYSVTPQPGTNYLDDLSKRQHVRNDSDKAWPIYRRAILKAKADLDAFCVDHIYASPNDGEQWTVAKSKLARLDDLLDEIRSGSKLPILGLDFAPSHRYHPADQNVFLSESQLPKTIPPEISRNFPDRLIRTAEQDFSFFPAKHLYLLRDIVSLLRIDTYHAIEISDLERAVSDVETSFGVSHQSANMKDQVESSVSIKLWNMSASNLEYLLENSNSHLTESQLMRLIRAIERTDLFAQFEPWNEIVRNQNRLKRYFTSNGKNDGHLTNDWYLLLSLESSGLFDIPNSSPNSDLSRWSIWTRPLIVFFGPSRRQIMSILDRHELLLREAWMAPYSRQMLEAAIETIRNDELPRGFERDFRRYLQYHDEITKLNLRRSEALTRLRSFLEERTMSESDLDK